MKKYFVFSDIHGEFDALQNNLIKMGFDIDNDDHVLFSLGDLFDRGPASDLVLDFMLDMWGKNRFIGIYGNHDAMLSGFLRDDRAVRFNLIYNGLAETINQLSNRTRSAISLHDLRVDIKEDITKAYPKLEEFLLSMKESIQFGKFIFTHAGYRTDDGKDWDVDHWADTPTFVVNFKDPHHTYVFGHWHASKLNHILLKKVVPDDKLFIYKNFIGLDMKTNITKQAAVCVLSENSDGDYELSFDKDKIL